MTARAKQKRIALVTAGYGLGGGVPAVCDFILSAIERDGVFATQIIDLATSFDDRNSVRLLSPATWRRGVRTSLILAGSRTVLSVGALAPELEFQRYRPRMVLDRVLEEFDIVQFVCGIPAWANVAARIKRPVFLQVATLAAAERDSVLRRRPIVRRMYDAAVLRVVAGYESAGLRRADAVFVENKWMVEHARRIRGGATGIQFSPPGVDTDCFCPGDGNGALTVLGVGRLGDARKNWRRLVHSFLSLPPDLVVQARLRLVGLGELEKSLRQEIASSVHRDRVEVISNVTRERLAAIYRESSVFALSSDEEGLGVVIMEAMASGLAVVATRCGGPEGLVEPGVTGYLVPRGDEDAFRLRLEELLRNPDLRARMGCRGRAKAEHEHSINAAGARFLNEYRRVLGMTDVADKIGSIHEFS